MIQNMTRLPFLGLRGLTSMFCPRGLCQLGADAPVPAPGQPLIAPTLMARALALMGS